MKIFVLLQNIHHTTIDNTSVVVELGGDLDGVAYTRKFCLVDLDSNS